MGRGQAEEQRERWYSDRAAMCAGGRPDLLRWTEMSTMPLQACKAATGCLRLVMTSAERAAPLAVSSVYDCLVIASTHMKMHQLCRWVMMQVSMDFCSFGHFTLYRTTASSPPPAGFLVLHCILSSSSPSVSDHHSHIHRVVVRRSTSPPVLLYLAVRRCHRL